MHRCAGRCYTSGPLYCCLYDNSSASSGFSRLPLRHWAHAPPALRTTSGDLHTTVFCKRQRTDTCLAAAAPEATALETVQQVVDHCSAVGDAQQQLARDVLTALSRYSPTGLSDGPASLTQVRPYNAAEVQQALQHGVHVLPSFNLKQLSNIAAALAAAEHLDQAFMEQLGHEAAQQLSVSSAPDDHVAALAQLKMICFLAVAYSRLGLLHVELLTQIALRGTALLQRHRILYPRKRTHGRHLALLAAAFAALKIQPPQLFRALGELLKQQRHVLGLLGPQESMLLLWAFARVQYKDPPAELLLLQRATTQVGQFDSQGLAHAYTQCAAVGLTAPPLLAALRKATRQQLRGMQPQQLIAVLVALAAMKQQDSLLMDELSKALHNKMANMTAAQISAIFSACSILRYRNPWLLEQASKMLVSSKLQKAVNLSALQLADILSGCHQLQYHNNLLLAHLGSVAAQSLCGSWTAAELAAVLQQFHLLDFYLSPMQLSAAQRLLQLTDMHQQLTSESQQQQAKGLILPSLIDASYHLACLPAAMGVAADRSAVQTAVYAVAQLAIQYQKQHQGDCCNLSSWIELSMALVLADAGFSAPGADIQQHDQQQEECRRKQASILHELLQHVSNQVEPATMNMQAHALKLVQLVQLLWLADLNRLPGVAGAQPESATAKQPQLQQQGWRLSLPSELVDVLLQSHLQQLAVQQQQQSGKSLLRPLGSALQQQMRSIPGTQLISPYLLAESPVAVPLAVLYSAHNQQPTDSSRTAVLLDDSQNVQQQQQLITVNIRIEPRRAVLPTEVTTLLQECRVVGKPIGFFDSSHAPGQAVAGVEVGWFTRSEPRLLLPLAALWQQGLSRAGWFVVVVQRDDAPDIES